MVGREPDAAGLEQLFQELRAAARAPQERAARRPEIPGYELDAELHRGGQGSIYLARRRADQVLVAIKVLEPHPDSLERDRRRFQREVELAGLLEHPGIVRILDHGSDDGRDWYAMELVDGVPLDDWVAEADAPLRVRLELFLRIVDAVAHAHRRGVIHRDLKPGNILVDESGGPHVLDFGLARSAGDAVPELPSLTASGEFLGTLAYAAPEQVAGGAVPDTRTDVYALGVLLYEMLTGTLPYPERRSVAGVIRGILEASPPDPRAHAPEVDADLRALLRCALAKEPERRYPGADALASDLRRYLQGLPVLGQEETLAALLRRVLRRRWRSLGLAVVVTAIAVVTAVSLLSQHLEAVRQRRNAAEVQQVPSDLLAAAAPERMGGGVTLVEVLAQLGDGLEQALAHAPDARATLLYTLGDTYRRLQRADEAERLLQAALEHARAAARPDPLELARILDALGLAQADQGLDAAVPNLEQALALRTSELGAGHPLSAAARSDLGYALAARYRNPDGARAETLLQAALQEQQAALPAGDLELAQTRLRLAALFLDQGRSEPAEAQWRAAQPAFAAPAASEDPRRLLSLELQADLARRAGRFDEAEQALTEAGELGLRCYGAEHASDVLRERARFEYGRSRYPECERLSRQALCLELRRWRGVQPARDERLEALLAQFSDQAPAAPPPYAEAFELLLDYRGRGAYELAGWMNGLALLEQAVGRPQRAEELLRLSLTVRCRIYGADCPFRMSALERLARLLADLGRPAEAIPLLEESLSIRARIGSSGDDAGTAAAALLESCRAAAR